MFALPVVIVTLAWALALAMSRPAISKDRRRSGCFLTAFTRFMIFL
jgi:hypothetical protein